MALGDRGAARERVRECAAIDVFELAADGHAVSDPRDLQAPAQGELPQVVRGRLALPRSDWSRE